MCATESATHSVKSSTSDVRKPRHHSILFTVAIVTIIQGLGCCVISLFDDVIPLSSDPVTMIGTMYLCMGLGFLVVSRLLKPCNFGQHLEETNKTAQPSSNKSVKWLESDADDTLAKQKDERYKVPLESTEKSGLRQRVVIKEDCLKGQDDVEMDNNRHEDKDSSEAESELLLVDREDCLNDDKSKKQGF